MDTFEAPDLTFEEYDEPSAFASASPALRWTDGIIAGAAGAIIYTLFETVAAGAFENRANFSELGAFYASSLLGGKADPHNALFVALGYALFAVVACLCGFMYWVLALRVESMVRTPSSLVWGLIYGLCVWLVLANVAVPMLAMNNSQPLWEALVGSMIFFGFPISECVTLLVSSRSSSAS